MPLRKLSAAEVRTKAAALARAYAADRLACGDEEGAGEFRDLAAAIARIRTTEQVPA